MVTYMRVAKSASVLSLTLKASASFLCMTVYVIVSARANKKALKHGAVFPPFEPHLLGLASHRQQLGWNFGMRALVVWLGVVSERRVQEQVPLSASYHRKRR